MSLFDLPSSTSSRQKDSKILQKSTIKVPKSIKGSQTLSDKIKEIQQEVDIKLADYKDKYECIRDEESLRSFIDRCIENKIAALDTETTGLNPMLDKIVGFSLYTPGFKAVYVPINHIDYVTKSKLQRQLSTEFCKEQLQRLVDANVNMIMFNAKFDIRVLRHQVGVYMEAYWDRIYSTEVTE